MKRYVFMVSDGTGITAQTLGNSLITQFEHIEFEKYTLPYIDSVQKANAAVLRINACAEETGTKPLVFITLVNTEIVAIIKTVNATIFDLFTTFLGPLEIELHEKSSYTVGKTHGVANSKSYNHRLDAVEYAMAHDDGTRIRGYEEADIILIGVSRCGKTPSCLYMALHFGIFAANYPFTEEDLHSFQLPDCLKPYKSKLFGLTIEPSRLHDIRTERRPNSRYASLEQCRLEVGEIEAMYQAERIPYLNSTRFSIEEITTKVLAIAGIQRQI